MEKIKSASLWHVTPVSIGIDFYNPTISTLTLNEDIYKIVSPSDHHKIPNSFSHSDFNILKKFKNFNNLFLEKTRKSDAL